MPAFPVRALLAFAAAASLAGPGSAAAAGAQAQARAASQIAQTRDFTVYEPAKTATAGACAPVAVISRGLGAGQAPMRSLSSALAQDGWRVVVMRHPEARRSLFEGRLVRSGRLTPKTGDEADPTNLRRRAAAIDAAIELAKKPCDPPFMALIGHAVGSTTALIEAGAKAAFAVPAKDRFNAYVAISPSGTTGGLFSKGAWAGISKPTLIVTGTRDFKGRLGWRARTAAYDDMAAGGKRLAVVQGATHIALGGLGSPTVRGKVVKIVADFLGDVRRNDMKADPLPGVDYKEK